MKTNSLSIREQSLNDNQLIIDYFWNSDANFLIKMGVEKTKLYEKGDWIRLLHDNYYLEDTKKSLYYNIWLLDNEPVGHCNINKIKVNEEAYLHLHLWQNNSRQKGLGSKFLKLSLPVFFERFGLKQLYCEPYALNPAPNKTLEKLGFEFIRNYETTPGMFNFYQSVNSWCLTKERMELL